MKLLSVCLAAALALGCAAASVASSPPSIPPSGLLIADGGLGGVLEIVRHDVRVTINNGIAVTEIEQVFHNTENRIVEALYTFPVPKNASVAGFSMWINGKEMVGEVVERERARQIYESYKRRGIDPGLLEQVSYKAFEMRIFPIAANAEQRVRVTYYQELDIDDDWCSYVYPLATTTRPGLTSKVRGRFSLSVEVKSEVPIVEMQSTSHAEDTVFVRHAQGYRQASLEATGADLDRDVVLAWRLERAQTGLDVVTSKQPGEDGYAMLVLTAGNELESRDDGMDYVFVSDVSGSMANDGKLVLSQRSVRAFLDALGKRDRFELISFNIAAETLFGGLSNVETDALTRAGEFLAGQTARGGTRLRPAVQAAYRYRDDDRPLNVVILSDGMTEQREHRELLQLIGARPAGVRVFCIGIGNDVNRPLLRQVARDSGGLAAFLSRGDDFTRQAKAFRRKLLRPAIADVSLTIEGGGVYDVEPEILPNLYHGQPLKLYARYKKPGTTKVTLRGTISGAAFERSFDVELPARDDSSPEIERMWAWHRVQRLLDDQRGKGDDRMHAAEIVRLCEGFSIVSEYASFLVLENDDEYERWRIERRNATRIRRDRAAQQRLRERLDELRDRAADKLGPMQPSSPRRSKDSSQARSSRSGAQPRTTPRRPSGDRRAPRHDSGGGGGGGGGGGAIDPLTGSVALGLLALAVATRRRRRDGDNEES